VDRKAPCNILLILNESLRADHIPALGGPRGLTPFLTHLLDREEGVIFPRFYAVATRTIIALPSWMTGISPVQSGQALEKAPIFSNYAKQLADTKTFLISSQPYEPGNVYNFLNDGSWDMLVCAENSGHPFQPATQSISDHFLPAYLDRFLSDMQPRETFLGVIHTFGTHHPYYSQASQNSLLKPIPAPTRYKEAIRALDANLREIVTILQKHGRFDNTIILSTSDHAEAMNEHGYWGHLRTFYNEEARVPGWVLIPRALRRSPAFARMYKGLLSNKNQYLSNIDIMPTVLDILGLVPPEDSPPLLGAPLTRPIQGPRIIRMQNYQDVGNAMFPGTALLYGHYKYILLLENGRKKHHLFDMTSDPEEQHNIWQQAPESLKKAIFSEIEAYPTSREVLTFQSSSPWVDLSQKP
jgi:arylsulfatase A-like enzyme